MTNAVERLFLCLAGPRLAWCSSAVGAMAAIDVVPAQAGSQGRRGMESRALAEGA